MKTIIKHSLLLILIVAWLLSACKGETTSIPTILPSDALPTSTLPTDRPTETSAPPTSTPEPLKAIVNGAPLTLAEFEAELARFLAAQTESGTNLATEEAADWVLNSLIDTILLAQAAAQAGFVVDEASVQTRMDELAAQLGGMHALTDWSTAHGYSDAQFRQALSREMAAAWMRDQIAASVQVTADQAHARQILLYNSEQAEAVLAMLQSGQDFVDLAEDYDPVTGGDLGWFPRGYLFSSAVEEAAFNLQPGEYSEVIETPAGFHLVQLIERDPQHPLSQDALFVLQRQAVSKWLAEQRNQSNIQVLVP